jgi:hypothetical protein
MIREGETIGDPREKALVAGEHDAMIGSTIVFSGLVHYGRPDVWSELVRDRQWLKSVAAVAAGARVTLIVPSEQRPWMRLEYAHRGGRGVHAVTLRACRNLPSLAAQRRECRFAPFTACRSGPTLFSGGFAIDYERAPRQGRCAELIVWTAGAQPLRRRLFSPQPGECDRRAG